MLSELNNIVSASMTIALPLWGRAGWGMKAIGTKRSGTIGTKNLGPKVIPPSHPNHCP